jgi:hypothetical protein
MDLKKRAVADLLGCWNDDAFRKIFNMPRFVSVKEMMFFIVRKLT